MVEVGAVQIFDAEIFHYKGERDFARMVVEEAVRMGALVLAVLGKKCAELLVRQNSSLC